MAEMHHMMNMHPHRRHGQRPPHQIFHPPIPQERLLVRLTSSAECDPYLEEQEYEFRPEVYG